jgi:hypothetical protein
MRYGTIIIILAAIMVTGCATTDKSYQTGVTVTPLKRPHEYCVEFTISEKEGDGKSRILSKPMVVCNAGQEAALSSHSTLYEGKVRNRSVSGTVLVTEAKSRVEAVTTLNIKEDGKEVLNTSQTMIVKR